MGNQPSSDLLEAASDLPSERLPVKEGPSAGRLFVKEGAHVNIIPNIIRLGVFFEVSALEHGKHLSCTVLYWAGASARGGPGRAQQRAPAGPGARGRIEEGQKQVIVLCACSPAMRMLPAVWRVVLGLVSTRPGQVPSSPPRPSRSRLQALLLLSLLLLA